MHILLAAEDGGIFGHRVGDEGDDLVGNRLRFVLQYPFTQGAEAEHKGGEKHDHGRHKHTQKFPLNTSFFHSCASPRPDWQCVEFNGLTFCLSIVPQQVVRRTRCWGHYMGQRWLHEGKVR